MVRGPGFKAKRPWLYSGWWNSRFNRPFCYDCLLRPRRRRSVKGTRHNWAKTKSTRMARHSRFTFRPDWIALRTFDCRPYSSRRSERLERSCSVLCLRDGPRDRNGSDNFFGKVAGKRMVWRRKTCGNVAFETCCCSRRPPFDGHPLTRRSL